MTTATFTITEEHLKLLKHMYVRWDDCEFGAPAIDSKRPYGNGDVIGDMHEILTGQFLDEEDEDYYDYIGELENKYTKLHEQMETVLQICLATLSFETGFYIREGYGLNWRKVA
jgi:hypothetical protein